MSTTASSEQRPVLPHASLVEGRILGWFAIAFLHTVLGLWLASEAQGSLSGGQRLLFVVYDLAQPLCLGLTVALVASALRGAGQRYAMLVWGLAALAAAGSGIALLQDDLAGVAGRL